MGSAVTFVGLPMASGAAAACTTFTAAPTSSGVASITTARGSRFTGVTTHSVCARVMGLTATTTGGEVPGSQSPPQFLEPLGSSVGMIPEPQVMGTASTARGHWGLECSLCCWMGWGGSASAGGMGGG